MKKQSLLLLVSLSLITINSSLHTKNLPTQGADLKGYTNPIDLIKDGIHSLLWFRDAQDAKDRIQLGLAALNLSQDQAEDLLINIVDEVLKEDKEGNHKGRSLYGDRIAHAFFNKYDFEINGTTRIKINFPEPESKKSFWQ